MKLAKIILIQFILFSAACGQDTSLNRTSMDTPKEDTSNVEEGATIQNGTADTSNKFPAVVALLLDGKAHCTGTIVEKRRILTAAHCVSGYSPVNRISAVVGAKSFKVSEGQVNTLYSAFYTGGKIKLENIELPVFAGSPDLATLDFSEDLGVIPMKIGKRATIGEYSIAGFGVTETGKLPTQRLIGSSILVAKIPSVLPGKKTGLNQTMLVTIIGSKNQATCSGDSGSPLISKESEVVGVLSGGVGKCGQTFSNTWTDVSNFQGFIYSNNSSYRSKIFDLDVTGDGFVVPQDALIVINRLQNGTKQLLGTNPESYKIDVDGDGYLAPLDSLRVINFLNLPASTTTFSIP